jgi:hypothetical protein
MHYGYGVYANHEEEMTMLEAKEIAQENKKKKKQVAHFASLRLIRTI